MMPRTSGPRTRSEVLWDAAVWVAQILPPLFVAAGGGFCLFVVHLVEPKALHMFDRHSISEIHIFNFILRQDLVKFLS